MSQYDYGVKREQITCQCEPCFYKQKANYNICCRCNHAMQDTDYLRETPLEAYLCGECKR